MLNPSNHSPEQQYIPLFLKQLVRRHPLACVSGLWVSLVLVGGVATVGLFNPRLSDQEESIATPTIETVQESTPQSTAQKDLPLGWLGGVAVGCAGGSLLVTQALKKLTERRYTAKKSKPIVTVRKKAQRSSEKRRPLPKTPQSIASHKDGKGTRLDKPLQNASSPGTAPPMRTGVERNSRPRSLGTENRVGLSSSQLLIPNAQFVDARLSNPLRNTSSSRVTPPQLPKDRFSSRQTSKTLDDRLAKPVEQLHVTVLPPEENHPLDGREESLADLLDLRKHHSLAALMRGKSLL